MYRQRFYYDGKLKDTSKPRDVEKLRIQLDRIQADWLKNGLFPLTPPGEFDYNNACVVTRVSIDELIVTTTGGHNLCWINVEVKSKGDCEVE